MAAAAAAAAVPISVACPPPPSSKQARTFFINSHEHAGLHGCCQAVEQVVVLAPDGCAHVQSAEEHRQDPTQSHSYSAKSRKTCDGEDSSQAHPTAFDREVRAFPCLMSVDVPMQAPLLSYANSVSVLLDHTSTPPAPSQDLKGWADMTRSGQVTLREAHLRQTASPLSNHVMMQGGLK
eukprot:1153367-Pelagomonas_calceolata.AAC.2